MWEENLAGGEKAILVCATVVGGLKNPGFINKPSKIQCEQKAKT